jgi:glyoxylase-like metal-dependent hydrolase (beta-lactamase superfamily II)
VAQPVPLVPSIDSIEVKSGIWMLRANSPVGNSTIVAIIDGEQAALLDVSMTSTASALRNWLEGRGVRRVVFVASSHHHADHTDGLAKLAEWTRPVFVTSIRQFERLRPAASTPLPWAGLAALGVPTLTVNGGETFHLGAHSIRMDTVANGHSHTDGDLMFDIDEGAVRYIGDHMFVDRYPVVDVEGGAQLAGYLSTVDCIAKSTPDDGVIIPGHALFAPSPLSTVTPAQLAAWRSRLLETIAEIRAWKEAGNSVEAAKAIGLSPRFAGLVEKPFFVRESRWIETVYQALDANQDVSAGCAGGR